MLGSNEQSQDADDAGQDGREPAKIHLNLDLEADVDLHAKIRGDVILGMT